MKEDKFKIIDLSKKFALNLDNVLNRFPNREKVLKDRIKSSIYDIIELIYNANYLPLDYINRIDIQTKILSKISLIDFLLEEAYRKGYISESMFKDKVDILIDLSFKVKGWISYVKSNSKRNT